MVVSSVVLPIRVCIFLYYTTFSHFSQGKARNYYRKQGVIVC